MKISHYMVFSILIILFYLFILFYLMPTSGFVCALYWVVQHFLFSMPQKGVDE